MRNFQYREIPMRWEHYFGQSHAKALARQWILRGAPALPRSLFCSGDSGTGKTSFIKLLMRSFRCLNRASDETEPCGTCPACLDLDERIADRTLTDIYWVQPGGYSDEETLYRQVKGALAAAAKGPRQTDRPTHDVLWVVFDEWQAFPSNLRQEILIRSELEVPGNNVCYCFCMMQEDKLPEQDRVALKGRGSPLRFRGFRPDEVESFLESRYPEIPVESRKILSESAQGSLRLAQAYLDLARQLDPNLSAPAVAKIAGAAPALWRSELWNLLQSRAKIPEIKTTVQSILEYCDRDVLVRQMQHDILESLGREQVTPDQTFALFSLSQALQNPRVELLVQLIPLIGMRLVNTADLTETSQPYSTI